MREKRRTERAPPMLMRKAIDLASAGASTSTATPMAPVPISCRDTSACSRCVHFAAAAAPKVSGVGTMAMSVSSNGLMVTSHCFTPDWKSASQDRPLAHHEEAPWL